MSSTWIVLLLFALLLVLPSLAVMAEADGGSEPYPSDPPPPDGGGTSTGSFGEILLWFLVAMVVD
ncbi:MAG: hypothetical protein QME66_00560 [Candidatus Eisenbacteria bacterium]|nr:hypothetical protein [Candidatus Eisenbacteria bacterium]